MREPWGISSIYGINDPAYRGLRYIDAATLIPLVELAVKNDLQFTAHCVGDGAVHALLDAYELVSQRTPKVASTHSCVTHSNFMSKEAIDKAAELGVCLDIQPAWLYLDTRTLVSQFGYDRLRYFQPLKSLFAAGVIAGGGSDHMQKIGSLRSINPYNPFLGMWTSIARGARWYEGRLHPEEALSREQAIRLYTWNSAYILRRENDLGSLEPGKLADFIIVDQDLLSCPLDAIKDTTVLATYLGGTKVYEAPPQ
jgi:predicted amidohydrolase YtcJ